MSANKLIQIIVPPYDPEEERSKSLWLVKGCLHLQSRMDDGEGDEIQKSERSFKVVVANPALAAGAFLRKASEVCGPLRFVVRAEIESIQWVSWVDAAVQV